MKKYLKIFSEKSFIVADVIVSMFFAFFLTVGYSVKTTGGIELIKDNLMKSIAEYIGYSALLFVAFSVAAYLVEVFLEKERVRIYAPWIFGKYIEMLRNKPFMTTFVTLFVCFLPFLIAAYPGLLMSDNKAQLAGAFNSASFNHYAVEYTGSKLDNHHPILHTLLMYGCIKTGVMLFGSFNIGIFFYVLIQFVFMLICFSYIVKVFTEQGFSDFWNLLFMMYVLFAGGHLTRYMFLCTKDIIYTGFMLLFLAGAYKSFKGKKLCIVFVISLLGMMAFRKDAYYIILLSLVFALLLLGRKKKLTVLALMVMTILVHSLWNNALLPAMGIMQGSKREMLSLPFQMTARYVRDCEEDVTEEEKEAIDVVLGYDNLAERYNPRHSSPVKNAFNESATSEDMKRYYKAFFSMMKKHPNVYFYALLEFKYELFYPVPFNKAYYNYDSTANTMEELNEILAEEGADFCFPQSETLTKYREKIYKLQTIISTYPIIGIFSSSSTYTWTLILLALYAIVRKNKYVFMMCVPFLAIIALCILGPQSGAHIRYLYPIQMALVPLIAMSMDIFRDQQRR
ncbi:DUF6020 family protein [Butyrivibrio sp. AC2005]|uniref:DUF6020 family protein n=1 Tax=Butyrivibrio sp. AC2005 TaxID=1280672 RepID=UPI00041D00A9|nr:DUF6020 family protein [Butyrivibrio sp. AC2005]